MKEAENTDSVFQMNDHMNIPSGNNVSERQTQIEDLVRQRGFCSIDSLADHFQVSPQTIRRDVNQLCSRGIAQRRHGGVQRFSGAANLAYARRQILQVGSKNAIADCVCDHIPDGASLAIGIGTTPEIVARRLLGHRNLRIFTNNLNVAMIVCANPTFEVTIAGGRLRNEDRDAVGSNAEALFSAYKVDIGIYGVAGVDDDGTLLDFYEEEVAGRQAIRRCSRTTFLVLDHTKFDRTAHVRGGHLTESTKVFCDRLPSPRIIRMLSSSEATLVVPEGNRQT